MVKIILASKSKVRKQILDDNNISTEVQNSNLDEDIVKEGLIKEKASHQPSGQYTLNDEYYKRIEAIQFTMNHDDGNLVKDIKKSDIILLGVSRTSKTPTSIYLVLKKKLRTPKILLKNIGGR